MERVKPLPNDKILDRSKLKAFADDKIKVDKNDDYIFGRIENLVVKGENFSYTSIFSLSHNVSKGFIHNYTVSLSQDQMVKS